jgi:hypothetical protein
MSYRVVQWTTGHVGREAARGVMRHPNLELVNVMPGVQRKRDKM